jgi:hypothetical protein
MSRLDSDQRDPVTAHSPHPPITFKFSYNNGKKRFGL